MALTHVLIELEESIRFFDRRIVANIIIGKKDFSYPVTTEEVAEVNKHLFPNSDQSNLLQIGSYAMKNSRPEIIAQLREQLGIDDSRGPETSAELWLYLEKIGANIPLRRSEKQ